MRALWLADVARNTGFPVVEVDGWEIRGSTTFNPQGVVWHHTAGRATGDMPSLNLLVNGRTDLPGPLAQCGLGRSGTIYIVAAGRANHAGAGGWNGLTGNSSVIGIEAEHTGSKSEPWPQVQLTAYRALTAGILRYLATTTDFMCAHREWAPTRKTDPVGLNMTLERQRVGDLLAVNLEEAQMAVSTWAQASWDKAKAKGIITADSHPQGQVTVEQLLVFLNRCGALDQVGNVPTATVDQVARDAAAQANQTLSKIKSVI